MNRAEADKFMRPIGNHHLFFCGFHVAKQNPEFQVTTMHYCGMRGEGDYEMHQCVLYDSVGPRAKLLGVEYIVSDKAFRTLPDEEQKYWHPHTYEVLGGGLVAPVMSDEAEIDFMTYLLTTWGKSWHTWPDPTTVVPLGEPMLMWSLTGDGQADIELIRERDRQFGVSTEKIQAERVEAIGYEVPQVPQPRSAATIGRQWTATGEDRPAPLQRSRLQRYGAAWVPFRWGLAPRPRTAPVGCFASAPLASRGGRTARRGISRCSISAAGQGQPRPSAAAAASSPCFVTQT